MTSYCDWSGISDAVHERIAHWPIVPKMALISTLEKLDALAPPRNRPDVQPHPSFVHRSVS